MTRRNTIEDLYRKTVTDSSGCQVWTACKSQDGYGRVKWSGKLLMAHRVAFEDKHGPIPEGLVIDHLCRNRACINVDHLRVVTRRENTLAEGSLATSKMHSMKTHCVNGHALVVENLVRGGANGKRTCKTCTRATVARYMERKRSA